MRDGMLSPDMVAYCSANSRAARRAQGAAGAHCVDGGGVCRLFDAFGLTWLSMHST